MFIPLARMSAEQITGLYHLMAAAYDAMQIHRFKSRVDLALTAPN